MPDIMVSGSIPDGNTTSNITYFVVDRQRNAIVGNLTLPNASLIARSFSLQVKVPSYSDSLDVGLFDDDGNFTSAGFRVEGGQAPEGAVGPSA